MIDLTQAIPMVTQAGTTQHVKSEQPLLKVTGQIGIIKKVTTKGMPLARQIADLASKCSSY